MSGVAKYISGTADQKLAYEMLWEVWKKVGDPQLAIGQQRRTPEGQNSPDLWALRVVGTYRMRHVPNVCCDVRYQLFTFG